MNKHSFAAGSRFLRNRSGVAAIEFALIVPIVIIMFFGCFEVTDYVRATMRTGQAAQSVAELIADQTSITNSSNDPAGSLSDYCYAAQAVILPYNPANLTVKIASYTQSNGSATNDWADICPSNKTNIATTWSTPEAPPAGLLVANGDSVIVVSASYRWNAPDGGVFLHSIQTATETAYVRPRSNTTITCSNSSC